MDSVIGDFFRNGRRLRPATEDFAVDNFPRLILRLKQNRLIVGLDTSVGNADLVVLRNPRIRHESWTILKSDFDVCKSIADKVSLHLFPGDNETIIMQRILGHVKVEFAGRGVP
jgi:hypothetical protein